VKTKMEEYKDIATDPVRKEKILREIEKINQEVRGVLGLPPAKEAATNDDAEFDAANPFPKVSQPKATSSGQPPSAPAPPGAPTDQSSQTYDQRIEERLKQSPFDAFEEWRKKHMPNLPPSTAPAGPSSVPNLQ